MKDTREELRGTGSRVQGQTAPLSLLLNVLVSHALRPSQINRGTLTQGPVIAGNREGTRAEQLGQQGTSSKGRTGRLTQRGGERREGGEAKERGEGKREREGRGLGYKGEGERGVCRAWLSSESFCPCCSSRRTPSHVSTSLITCSYPYSCPYSPEPSLPAAPTEGRGGGGGRKWGSSCSLMKERGSGEGGQQGGVTSSYCPEIVAVTPLALGKERG